MMFLFDINEIVITILGYQMSYVELLGTAFGLWCVWLTVRENIWCWPIGIINIVFFFVLFYQVNLYSDMLLQVYFLIMSFYGWWKWLNPAKGEENQRDHLRVSRNSARANGVMVAGGLAAVIMLGSGMSRVHLWLPSVFSQPAAYPFWDAATTVMSVIATVLLAKKRVEAWALWISVDLICIVIYYLKGVMFMSLEYLIFGIIATSGLITWTRQLESQGTAECLAA